jgi:trehalose/maltose transport system substrate-binding protein
MGLASGGASMVLIGTALFPVGHVNAKAAHRAALATYTLNNPPSVNGAAMDKKYKGQTIIFYGDNVGIGQDVDKALDKKFTAQTGIKVDYIAKPSQSDAAYSFYSKLFTAHSSKMDVAMIDTIWPGSFATDLLNLKPALGSTTKHFYSTLIANDTVKGKLVAMPEFGDLGMLYYRKDLLTKYHIMSPPTTWTQLAADAKKIQAGEQKNNKSFYGFVWQGSAYEGLTCDAMEWIASAGGGTVVSGNKITLNNAKAANMLNMVHSWVGTIAPKDVTTYTETESDNAFNAGNAAFMRNWPYAYAVSQGIAKLKGKVGVVPLPHAAGAKSVGTVGGWQLAVNKYSKHPGAAEAFIRYVTQPSSSVWLSAVGSFVPTQPATANNAAVQKAMPFLKAVQTTTRVTRPAKFFGTNYNQASSVIWNAAYQAETNGNASSYLSSAAQQLQRLLP